MPDLGGLSGLIAITSETSNPTNLSGIKNKTSKYNTLAKISKLYYILCFEYIFKYYVFFDYECVDRHLTRALGRATPQYNE